MPSQFFGLNIAYTGLLASNAAMNTTANNIANVQTEGYSRQRVCIPVIINWSKTVLNPAFLPLSSR